MEVDRIYVSEALFYPPAVDLARLHWRETLGDGKLLRRTAMKQCVTIGVLLPTGVPSELRTCDAVMVN